MEEQLRLAVKLQGVEDRRRALQAEIQAIPRSLEAITHKAREQEALVTERKAAIESGRKDKRRLEGDIEAMKAKIGKYRDQLLSVKTNKEYAALLHEIEEGNGVVRGVEDRILEIMEREDQYTTELKEREAVLATIQRELREAESHASSVQAGLQASMATLDAERDGIRAGIDREILSHFDKVYTVRSGLAVVRVRGESCEGCRVRVRPQVMAEMRRWEKMHVCDSCKRILYIEEPAPAEVPAPDVPAAR